MCINGRREFELCEGDVVLNVCDEASTLVVFSVSAQSSVLWNVDSGFGG